MLRVLAFVVALAGSTGLVIASFNFENIGKLGLSMFTYPLGWIAFSVLLFVLARKDDAKTEAITVKDKHIRRLGETAQSHLADIENLERNLGHARDVAKQAEASRDAANRDASNYQIVIRRLNSLLQENGIDTRAANVMPPKEGQRLASEQVARQNPTPPPRLSESLRPEVVRSSRSSMASPSPSSSPVHHHHHHDSGPGFGTGLLVGSMLSDSAPAHRSEPEPTRCEPAPSYSEPSRSYDAPSPSPTYDSPTDTSSPSCD